MADPELTNEQKMDAAAEWLRANTDKQGSPDFVKVADYYRSLKAPPPETGVDAGMMSMIAPDSPVGASYDMPKESPFKDPNSANSIVARGITSAATAIPDTYSRITNLGLNPFAPGKPSTPMPELGATARSAMGIQDMPTDAPFAQKALETVAPVAMAAPSGLAAGSMAALAKAFGRNVALPIAGGEVGSTLDKALGGTGDIGGLIGSIAAPHAPTAATRFIEGRYTGRPAPTQIPGQSPVGGSAAGVNAAAERQGVPTNPAQLGDASAQRLSQTYEPTGGKISTQRDATVEGMRNAALRTFEQRRTLPQATPDTAQVVQVAQNARNTPGRNIVNDVQQHLEDKVGSNTPADVTQTLNDINRIVTKEGNVGANAPLAKRLQDLQSMAFTWGGKQYIPYTRLKQWRTDLRENISHDAPGVTGELHDKAYDAATQAMKATALRRGVSEPAFDTAQQITVNELRAGDLGKQMQSTIMKPGATTVGQFGNAMTPEAINQMGRGTSQETDVTQNLRDLQLLARTHQTPTSSGRRPWIDAALKWGPRVGSGGAGALAGTVLGGPVGGVVAGTMGALLPPAVSMVRQRMLASDMAKRGMLGQRTLYTAPTMSDLLAQIAAARQTQ